MDIHTRPSVRTQKLLALLGLPTIYDPTNDLPFALYQSVNKYLTDLEHEVFDVTKRRAAAIATEKVGHTIKDYLPGSVIAAKIMAMRMV